MLATPEGTRRYAARMADRVDPRHFRPWPPAEDSVETAADERGAELLPSAAASPPLLLSSIGMGSYLGPATDAADQAYAESVRASVQNGINVIDCAINYRHMRSERALGRGLRELFEAGTAARDEIFVMTKGGYLPFDGAPPSDVARYFERTYLKPGIFEAEDVVEGVHCIAPRFLRDQLTRSLANFALDACDVYFLHNPEQQVSVISPGEFRDRMAAAFEFLEEEVGNGRIGRYGVASWNAFRVPPGEAGHISLAELIGIAESAAGPSHHFEVVQLPYNLGMPEALTSPTQDFEGERVPFLEAAARAGMMVVTSVPLVQTRILPHVPPAFAGVMPALPTPAQKAIQFARSTPGVAACLVGMGNPAHVAENAHVAQVPPLSREEFFSLFG